MMLPLPVDELRALCVRYGACELAVFGSGVRGGLRPDSDIDLLVEFDPGSRIGFIALARMEMELSALLGRPVDLVSKRGLNPLIREAVLAEAEVVVGA